MQIGRALILASLAAAPALAQEQKPDRIVRVGIGPQIIPKYPGADDHRFSPLWDISLKREGETFVYEAPDESFGFSVLSAGGVEIGPVANLESRRRNEDVGAPVGNVDRTVEIGGFVHSYLGPSFRVRAEGRKGINGHEGWVGTISADYIARRGDDYVFSVGPRLLLSDGRYQRAFFGVTPAVAAATGLPAFAPDGGVHAIGATTSLLHQLGRSWGVFGYGRYDRLIGDAADSPIVDRFGKRDQFSAGLGITYTFRVRSRR